MSYQNVTGSLMANTHPGSYSGQDTYNDMLVTVNENMVHWGGKRMTLIALMRKEAKR